MNVVAKFDDFVRYYGGFVQDDFPHHAKN